MKKIMFLPVLLLGLLMLVSCEEQAPVSTSGGAFIGGTTGLVASFEPLSVKEGDIYTIFDSEDFSLDIQLVNKGEEDLQPEDATLRLLGPAHESFENIPAWEINNQRIIEKVSQYNPTGGEESISFSPDARAKFVGSITGYQDINWNLEYWYNYKTHLIVNDVCFKSDLSDTKVCNVKEAKVYSVSGAPITVTKVEEDVAGKGIIMLRIDVQNAGLGKSTIKGTEFDARFDQISFSLEDTEKDKWECTSGGRENEARLIKSETGENGVATAQIICRLKTPLNDGDLYTKSLGLTLDYTYKDLIQEKLRIKEGLK